MVSTTARTTSHTGCSRVFAVTWAIRTRAMVPELSRMQGSSETRRAPCCSPWLACESPRVVDRDRARENEPSVSRARVSALGCQLGSADSSVDGIGRCRERRRPRCVRALPTVSKVSCAAAPLPTTRPASGPSARTHRSRSPRAQSASLERMREAPGLVRVESIPGWPTVRTIAFHCTPTPADDCKGETRSRWPGAGIPCRHSDRAVRGRRDDQSDRVRHH
jgi:hypothetical protein